MMNPEEMAFELEFMKTFEKLTGASSPDHMLANFNGYNYVAFVAHFWPKIYHFPLREDDVIIASFPKCGTTWTQQIVWLIRTQDFEAAEKVPISKRIPFMEMPSPPKIETLDKLAAQSTPRLLKTHLAAKHLPKEFAKAKLIYVYRNPKDVVVSLYFHLKLGAEFEKKEVKPFDEFARDFMSGNVLFGPYPDSLESYAELKKSGHQFLTIRYEDMKKDQKGAIRKIAAYLGKDLSEEMVDKINEATSFKAMQKNPATNYTMMYFEKPEEHTQFIRQGKVGGWKEHFAPYPELLKEFDGWIAAKVPEEMRCDEQE